MIYYHVDVFSSMSLSGNGLTVVMHDEDISNQKMQDIAREFKQFETIFIKQTGEDHFRARIFTVQEELDFAGHPVLGAVAVVNEHLYHGGKIEVEFELNKKTIKVTSEQKSGYYCSSMNQGTAEFIGTVPDDKRITYLDALGLSVEDLHETLPMQVVSTGLRYLLIPLRSGLEKARIRIDNFEEKLSEVGAKFVYVFDVAGMEGRTWDNFGEVEDVATGSAAGPMGAYLWKSGVCSKDKEIIINQGRFTGRPSILRVDYIENTSEIMVSGDVKIIADGNLRL